MAQIPQFPNYTITKDGKVYSLKRKRFLKPQQRNGYLYVELRRDNKTFKVDIHRLLMITFKYVPNYATLQVNHKDGNKHNNSLSNLEWVTCAENLQHALDTGLRRCGNHRHTRTHQKLQEDDVRTIRNLFDEGSSMKSLAEQFGVSITNIRHIVEYKTWKTVV